MERDVLVVVLRHLEDVGGVRHEDIAPVFVGSHVLGFALLEHLEFGIIVRLNPAGFVHLERLPTAFGLVLVLETVLNNLELQLPDRANNLASVHLADKELRHALVHELVDAFVELLLLHGVSVLDVLEHLG